MESPLSLGEFGRARFGAENSVLIDFDQLVHYTRSPRERRSTSRPPPAWLMAELQR